MGKSLNAGWAQRDITPYGRKVSLYGQFYERLTEEIDCALTVTALAADNGISDFTWVSCDLTKISAVLNEDVRNKVRIKAPNINSAGIILSATHTHTAPYFKLDVWARGDGRYETPEGVLGITEYHEFLVDMITEAVIEANGKKAAGCTAFTAVSPVKTGCCRRGIISSGEAVMYIDVKRPDFVRMEGPDGGPINLMYIKDSTGKTTGVIACIPCPAQVLEHQFYISSDYAGRVRNMLKAYYGPDFFFLPLLSSCGDLSPRNLVTRDYGFDNMYDKEGADNMARRIFDAILREEAHPAEIIDDFSDFKVVSKKISLQGWLPSEEEYSRALSLKGSDATKFDIRDYVQKGVEPYFHTPLALAKKVETVIARFEDPQKFGKIDSEIFAVRFGETVWVSNPFELFREYADRMAAHSKARSFWSIQLTYDGFAYLPTTQAAKAGGYGAFISSSRADPFNAGELLVKESVSLADSLF